MNTTRTTESLIQIPQLWIGLLLILVFWPLNWLLEGLRTHILFFPLWLGYILAVDGLVLWRRGSSLLQRNRWAFVGLFVASAPCWWLFEVLNWRTGNWVYLGDNEVPFLLRVVLKTINFSTVMPAVFGTAELVSTFAFVCRLRPWIKIKPTRPVLLGFFTAGVVMLTLVLVWPATFFPLLWLSLYFTIAPFNAWRGYRTLASDTARGDWRPAVALMLGCLICGFFWEMWNIFAFPKWVYHVPPFEFLYIFEMPLLGYGGYLPFALELFALYHLIVGLFGFKLKHYIQLVE